MAAYPTQLDKDMKEGAGKALYHIWFSVRPYPPKPPTSTYDRTGLLGKSLGTSEEGGRFGTPDVFKVTQLGAGNYEARFGTRLHYAPRVIGEGTQETPWINYWWNMLDILNDAKPGILKIFEAVAQKMAEYLDGK
jgi:hypothetical protein